MDRQPMNRFQQQLDLAGTISGGVGTLSCLFAVTMRYAFGPGNFEGMHIAPRTIILGGIALLVFGCWLKLMSR